MDFYARNESTLPECIEKTMTTNSAATFPALPQPGLTERARIAAARFVLNRFLKNEEMIVRFSNSGLSIKTGKPGGQAFTMQVDNPAVLWDIIKNPDPRLGETWMDGTWDLPEGDLGQFVTMLGRNGEALLKGSAGALIGRALRPPLSDAAHDEANSRDNVRHHYDIGNDLYEQFLDEGMNYSCAFFSQPDMDLRTAQLNKLTTSIERLDVRPGMKVLDIGCGWGELCRMIATHTGAQSVTGITLAENQLAVARERGAAMGESLLSFQLEDYREHAKTHHGVYDRIISIGMLEHVGTDGYQPYFAAIRDQLAPGGRALVHSIVNADTTPNSGKLRSVWLQRYIFPGGEIPELQEMIDAAAQNGLRPAVAPYLQPPAYYAETLRHWRRNFIRNYSNLDSRKYDERFRRMFLYYFAMCEAMFDGCGFQVAQVAFEQT
jgi:cyclopropane-fatty-acyl-phospholipid synthase